MRNTVELDESSKLDDDLNEDELDVLDHRGDSESLCGTVSTTEMLVVGLMTMTSVGVEWTNSYKLVLYVTK